MPDVLTNPDPAAAAWGITDPVIRLRQLGTEQVFDLTASERWVLGAAAECAIRINDASGCVSRRHVELRRDGATWTAKDLGSTNGIRHNREDRRSFQLAAGDEIELGGVTLIAESQRSAELHELLQRLLGWSASRAAMIDRAFRAVREMASLRAVLILHGDGVLLGTARRLHQATLPGRRFVVLDAGGHGEAALQLAGDGLLCIDARALPHDLEQMVLRLCMPSVRTRLVVCAKTAVDAADVSTLLPRVATIRIPSLAERAHELDRLVRAYWRDATVEQAVAALDLRASDLERIRVRGVQTLAEIEDIARRLVAIRAAGVVAGARQLGITHGAVSRWLKLRKLSRA